MSSPIDRRWERSFKGVSFELPFRDELTQQYGFPHAAAITAIVNSACGYAALTVPAAKCPTRPQAGQSGTKPEPWFR